MSEEAPHYPSAALKSAARYDSMLAMLRSLEWCRTEWSGTRGTTLNHYCPACAGTPDEGHSPDCELARLLQSPA